MRDTVLEGFFSRTANRRSQPRATRKASSSASGTVRWQGQKTMATFRRDDRGKAKRQRNNLMYVVISARGTTIEKRCRGW